MGKKQKKYRLIGYIRIEPADEVEHLTLKEAEEEKEQAEFLFPENIYKIEEVE